MQSGEIDEDGARGQLERILASAGFNRNERLSRFLRFVVERHLQGNQSDLKESVIAVEVFGRRADYDPKLDSIVRTEAGRLRTRLADYYSAEGATDSIIIEMPKGGYVPAIRSRTPQKTNSSRRLLHPRLTIAAALFAVLAAAAGWWWSGGKTEPITIAVLPLENLGHDPSNDYFVDGLTDEIINNLSLIDGLVVRSRTSSFALKGKAQNIRETANQLQTNYLVEGSVLRSGEKLRVNAQLVRVRDDFALWSGKFDREAVDVFAIQDEISRGIVNNLRLKLGAGQRRYNTNLEAYDLYLQARQLVNEGISPLVPRSIELFEQVLMKDAGFAPAYTGLAQAYSQRSSTLRDLPILEGTERMTEYVDKALQLDPLLPDAWTFRGEILARAYQWTESEEAYRRAIELNPSLAEAHENYGANLLFKIGKRQQGIQEVRKAVALDPLSDRPRRLLAYLLLNDGRPDDALDALNHLQSTANPFAKQYRGRALLQKKQYADAISYLDGDGSQGFLGLAYGWMGRRTEAETMRTTAQFPNQLALVCAGLQDKDCVFESLNQMADVKDPRIQVYIVYPELALIRGDPRLGTLRRKIGLGGPGTQP
jgi:TolB-like protein/Tfp pilus assembly protein PilF